MSTEDEHSSQQGSAFPRIGPVCIQANRDGDQTTRRTCAAIGSSVICTPAMSGQEGLHPYFGGLNASENAHRVPGTSTPVPVLRGKAPGRRPQLWSPSCVVDDLGTFYASGRDWAAVPVVHVRGRRRPVSQDRNQKVTHPVSRTHRELMESSRASRGVDLCTLLSSPSTTSRRTSSLPVRRRSTPRGR